MIIGSPPRREAKYTAECREKKMELICKKGVTNMLDNCYALDRQTDKVSLSFFPAYNFTTPFKGRARRAHAERNGHSGHHHTGRDHNHRLW